VVVDVGTLRGGTPAWPVLQRADRVVMVASPEVSAVVASMEWLKAGGRVSPSDPGFDESKAGLVVVDSPGGLAFPRSTLVAELGDCCKGWLPWEPATVDLVHRGAPADDRRLRKSALIGATQRLLADLSTSEGEPA
jgi:hypothetical protein